MTRRASVFVSRVLALTLVLGLGLTLGVPLAQAGSKRCRDLPANLRAACKREVAAKCGSVQGYWPKRRCEDKVVASQNPCKRAAVVKAFNALQRQVGICRAASQPVGNKTWAAQTKALAAVTRNLAVLRPVTRQCPRIARHSAYRACTGAKAAARSAWGRHVGYMGRQKLKILWGHINGFVAGKKYADAAAQCKANIARYQKVIALNKHPWLRANVRRLVAAISAFKAKLNKLEAQAQKAMAKKRPPRPTGASRRYHRKLKKMARAYFHKPRKNYTEKMTKFGLDGRVKITYTGPLKSLMHQHQMAIALLKRTYRDRSKKRYCYYIYPRFIRSKHVRSRKWGPWRIRRFTNHNPVLCKNLRW